MFACTMFVRSPCRAMQNRRRKQVNPCEIREKNTNSNNNLCVTNRKTISYYNGRDERIGCDDLRNDVHVPLYPDELQLLGGTVPGETELNDQVKVGIKNGIAFNNDCNHLFSTNWRYTYVCRHKLLQVHEDTQNNIILINFNHLYRLNGKLGKNVNCCDVKVCVSAVPTFSHL